MTICRVPYNVWQISIYQHDERPGPAQVGPGRSPLELLPQGGLNGQGGRTHVRMPAHENRSGQWARSMRRTNMAVLAESFKTALGNIEPQRKEKGDDAKNAKAAHAEVSKVLMGDAKLKLWGI